MASLQAGRRRSAKPGPGRAAQPARPQAAAAEITLANAADPTAREGHGPVGAASEADAASAAASGSAQPGLQGAQPGAAAALSAGSIGVLLAAAGAAAPHAHSGSAEKLPTPDALAAALAELPADVQVCQAPQWLWACMPDPDLYKSLVQVYLKQQKGWHHMEVSGKKPQCCGAQVVNKKPD